MRWQGWKKARDRWPWAVAAVVTSLWLAFPLKLERSAPNHLVIERELLARLHVLATGLQNEIILCLSGETRGDTAVARDWRMPLLAMSTPIGAAVLDGDCDPARDLAMWHNHPPDAEGPAPCYLSWADLKTAVRTRLAFQIVQTPHEFCSWKLSGLLAYHDSIVAHQAGAAR